MEIPGYKIIDTLGQGGMATVYLAIQQSFDREVALKVMSPVLLQSDPSFGERFIREARIVSRLVHPNIVTVFDVGVADGHHFLSMEYVPGEDLKEKRLKLSMVERIKVVKDIALALDFAGKKGYVHRDVKPENIMIHEEDGRALLMDFGIARVVDNASNMTQTGTAIGTPHYMSPEQARGHAVDTRSDIYSLGVILFFLLSGYVPFTSDSAVSIGIMHVSEPIPLLANHIGVFQPIIDKVLAKNPQDRYQNGREFITALNAISDTRLQAIDDVAAELKLAYESGCDNNCETVVGAVAAADNSLSSNSEAAVGLPEEPSAPSESFSGVFERVSGATSEELPKRSSWRWSVLLLSVIAMGLWWQKNTLLLMFAVEKPNMAITDSSSRVPAQIVNDIQAEIQADQVLNDNPKAIDSLQDLRPVVPAIASVVVPEVATEIVVVDNSSEFSLEATASVADYHRVEPEGDFASVKLQDEIPNERLNTEILEDKITAEYADDASTLNDIAAKKNAKAQLAEKQKIAAEFAAKQAEIEALLLQAKKYVEVKSFVEPESGNALQSYQKVLVLEPENEAALGGIASLLSQLLSASEQAQKSNKLLEAKKILATVMVIDPGNAQAAQRQTQIVAELKLQARLSQLQRDAENAIANNRLLHPAKSNAVYHYKQMQSLQANNKTAKQGLKNVRISLMDSLDHYIETHDFELAKTLLSQASQAFQSAEIFIEQRQKLAATIDALTPKVSSIQVRSKPFDNLMTPQVAALKGVDRTIYIGFRYQDFQREQSVLHGVLFDGAHSLEITQVPVVVSGREGMKFFRIERPIHGFAAGGYSVDIMLAGNVLASTLFNVTQ